MTWRDVGREVLATSFFENVLRKLTARRPGRAIANFVGRPCGVYRSFAEASAATTSREHAGHEASLAIQRHVQLSGTIRPSDYAAIYWISRAAREILHVFDYGGNVGNLYYSYRPYLPESIRQLTWTVFDLPLVVQSGLQLAKQKQATELEFRTTVQSVTRTHLVLVSGALHYWETALSDFIAQFPEKPVMFVINRTPVHPSESYVAVQLDATYAVPCFVRSTSEIIAEFTRNGYDLADTWQAPELSLRMKFFPHLSIPYYSGFCFIRSDQFEGLHIRRAT